MNRIFLLLPLLCLAFYAQAQYSEPFSVAGKGYKINNIDDITGINWSLSPWNVANRDAGDYFNTTAAGKLECIDLDEEVYWESPLINTTAANPVSIKMDLSWAEFDTDVAANDCSTDYIKVEYSVNGGAYVMIPNVAGGNACATVAYPFQNPGSQFSGSISINHGGVAGGSTLKIRIKIKTNQNAELATIDNVEVPEAGVNVGCAAPTLTTVVTPVGCSNPNSGAIDLTVSGGTPGYTYSWTGGATTQDISGKPTGTYTVTVTDAASCSATISAVIGNAPTLTLTTQVLDASCSGNTDGEISLDVTGGVPGYTYDWSNDGPDNPDNDPQDLINLGTGTYTVTVTDASGCTKTISATVGVLPSGAYLEQFNAPNKGYLPNYVDDFAGVNWTMGPWAEAPPAPFGREVNDYFRTSGGVLVGIDFDQEICWTSPLISLDGGTQFSVDLTWATFDQEDYINVNYSIDGGAFMQVPNVVGGGSGTIDYPPPALDQSGSTTVTKTGLSGSTIQIQVCGNFNTESMTLDNVNIPGSNNYCPAPEPTLTGTNVSCNGGNNGTITTTVVNGTTPYTYAWSDNGPATQNRTGLAAGTYTVTVTDANMATGTASIQITQPSAIVLTETHVNVLCNGAATGSIDLTVTGGTGAYTYTWTGGATTQDRSGLVAGTYTVTVTDANGCTKTLSVSITQPNALTLTETHVNILCNGAATGSIDLTVTGGNGAYTYSWTGGATTQDRSGLIAGTYTVTVTDANACTKTLSVAITQPAALSLSAVAANPTNCNVSDGTIDLTPTGGVSGYTYDWSNDGPDNPDDDTQDLTGLSSGTYTVTVTDANACTATHSSTLVTVDGTPPSITCPANATVNANASCQSTIGSYSPASLSDNCNPNPTVTQSPASSTLLTGHNATQTVTLTANDGNGNTASCTLTVTLKDVTPPTLTCQGNVTINANASCQGSLGLYTLTALDNCTPSLGYTQNPPIGTILTGHNTVQIVTLSTTDDAGNPASCTLTVTLKDVTPPSITCPANTTVSANASCQGQIGSYSPASLSDNCNPSPSVTQSPAASTLLTGHNAAQTVTLTANDNNGNTSTCSLTVTLKDVTPPSLTCPSNATVNANASCQGQVGSYSAASLTDNCNPSPTVTQSPVSSTLLTGHNATQTVTLTANDGNGNTSTCTLTVTLKDVTPPVLTCQGNVTINANASCQGVLGLYTLTANDNCTPSLGYTQNPSNGTIITGHNFVQVVTLSTTDNAGNPASCTLTVTLKDVTPPAITCPANVSVAANASCQGQIGTVSPLSVSDNCNPSSSVTQSPAPTTLLTGHNTAQTVTLTANDGNGNTATCTTTVTLKDVTPPSITCPPNATVNANASCQGTVGSRVAATLSDNCNPTPVVTQSPASSTVLNGHNASQTVTLTANDGNGNTATCTLTVTLKDVTPPTITCPANATVNANASCQGQVGSYTAATLSDNCNPSPTVTQTPVSSTLLTGHNATQTVTLTANDGNGNTSSCTLTVTLKDVTPPSITCPANTTVAANASCQGTIGSYSAATLSDNCNPSPTVTQSPVSSTVLNGHNAAQTVTLTANDGNGNTSTCTLTVTLKDVTPPALTCQGNVTINANASCQGVLGLYTLTAIDNCTPSLGYTQSPSDGTIITGHNTVQVVTLSTTDIGGNPASCTLTVTLKDVTPPTITCPANVTVAANASCQGQIGTISPSSATDNCNPSPTVTQSPAATTVLTGHNAAQTVTLTANDNNGNTATCTTTVTLKDVTKPVITCPANVTINANASCQGTLGSYAATALSDNCNPSPTMTQSPVSSTVLTGHNATQTVTLTANDGNGNTATCTLTVTLKDVTPPSVTCPANTTVNANASCQGQIGSYSANTLSDNCNPSPTVTQSPVSSTLLSGHNAVQTVTLTANDGNGNTATCTLTVTLKDVTPPTITCPANTTVAANASCQGQLGSYSPASLSDNCNASPTVTQSPASSTTLSGHNATQTVTLTANDNNGNTASCSLTVTLKDVTKPVITCPANVTVNANASCQGTISAFTPTALSDNCNPTPSAAQSPAAGSTISGHNTVQTVTLTATDVAGNTQTCTLTVTLKDVTPPTIVCKGFVANLNANGNVSISPADVYQSGADNCGTVNLVSVVSSTFSCNNIGPNIVILTANDGNGNTATCNATVTVRDVTPPVAKCQNVTANIGPNGTVTVPAAAVNNGSTDNCSITFTLTPNTFNCAQIGMQMVTLKATDPGGNTATCLAKVTVQDITGPIAKCKNPTIFLDETGHATLSSAQVNNGSTDNCGISAMNLDFTQFSCAELAGSPWPVNMSLTDVNGNSSTCLVYVTVKDAIAPTAVCEDVTVALGPNGKVTVFSADLAYNSTDNCSVWSYSPIAKVYTTANLGANNLTITVKDWSANGANCVSVVTVILPSNGDFQNGGGEGKGGQDGIFDLSIYPNPTSGEAMMAFELPEEQLFAFRIFDTSGRMVFSQENIGQPGENFMPLQFENLLPGVYVIDFQTENWKVQKRVLLQR